MTDTSYRGAGPVRPPGVFQRFSDVALVGALACIIALMILPLPAIALDTLIAVNIAIGIMLLMVGVYIASPVEFSAFPSLLLITTLYRLSLSIAATRMILLEGHAGKIIDTFGNLVAGGNLVVGIVVFVIITVVQFIVIAKGAERVAEVAARFSLDAMPGKQLSIDSDLRSGLLDKDEARKRRKVLELESKLHGSLDGAMKFVKGDAIAGIIIVVVNIVGGLLIGVLQKGLSFGDAIQTYSILTIGDGMVTQIPALLGAMAAGLIVTRTTDAETETHLGDALRRQLSAKPRVFLMAGALMLAMALVPGFPWPVFVALGLAAVSAGIWMDPALRAPVYARLRPLRAAIGRDKPRALEAVQTRLLEARPMEPLVLDLSGRGVQRADGVRLTAALEAVLDRFNGELGLVLPPLHVHAADGESPPAWRLLAYEAPIGAGDLHEGEDPVDALIAPVREALRRHLGLFVGIQETSNLLTRVGAEYPEVVKEVGRALPVARVAEVLRRMVEEEVSLRNLRDVLEALADAGQREKDPFNLTEFARVALRRQLSHRYAPSGALKALTLSPKLEARLREAIRSNAGSPQLALEPQEAAKVLDAFIAAVRRTGVDVVLAPIDLRRHVRKLIEPDLFNTAVLSFHELLPTLKLDIVDRVSTEAPVAGYLEAAE